MADWSGSRHARARREQPHGWAYSRRYDGAEAAARARAPRARGRGGGAASPPSRDRRAPPSALRPRAGAATTVPYEALRFDNGVGGFSADGSEYVIRLAAGADGPRRRCAWINVVANEHFGFLRARAAPATPGAATAASTA